MFGGGLAITVLALIFVYYAPLVPFKDPIPNCTTNIFCPRFATNGLDSITASLNFWGATYSPQEGGYNAGWLTLGSFQYTVGANGYITTISIPGEIVIFLGVCALLILLSPEIVDGTYLLSVRILGDKSSTSGHRALMTCANR
jgi:hypothetical protein